jgi:inosine/guanosine/xanthosine phosphorylase family protein
VRAGCAPTDLLVVRDHLNFQGVNPLTGPAFGMRVPDLPPAYDRAFRRHLVEALVAEGLPPHQGILAATSGPTYETPAEVRMLRMLGADVVGMSTVPEVLAAAEVGLRCAALVVISNAAAGISGEALTHTEVTDAAQAAAHRLQRVLQRALPGLVQEVS